MQFELWLLSIRLLRLAKAAELFFQLLTSKLIQKEGNISNGEENVMSESIHSINVGYSSASYTEVSFATKWADCPVYIFTPSIQLSGIIIFCVWTIRDIFFVIRLCLLISGAEILTFPSAFTVETGLAHWETLLRARYWLAKCLLLLATLLLRTKLSSLYSFWYSHLLFSHVPSLARSTLNLDLLSIFWIDHAPDLCKAKNVTQNYLNIVNGVQLLLYESAHFPQNCYDQTTVLLNPTPRTLKPCCS